MVLLSDTDRNLQFLQAAINTVAEDLATFTKGSLARASLAESLSRLIERKETLAAKQERAAVQPIDRVANYILRRGEVTYEKMRKSGCISGGANVLNAALEDLAFLGLLEVTEAPKRKDNLYRIKEFAERPSLVLAESKQEFFIEPAQ